MSSNNNKGFGRDGAGRNYGGRGESSNSAYGVKNDDRLKQGGPLVQGQPMKVGLYGRGMLAGFDRDVIPGRKGLVLISLFTISLDS